VHSIYFMCVIVCVYIVYREESAPPGGKAAEKEEI